MNVCCTDAIHMTRDEEGFDYPQIDEARCTDCGRCESVCPMRWQNGEKRDPRCFGAQAQSDVVRHSSSSGGVFSLLAQFIFQRQGVVYGAAYDAEMNVAHRGACDREQLEAMKRTKYVQSKLAGIYCEIKHRLEEGKWVLFCGTPCQTLALKLFLSKPYPKLVLVDLICYGVPSPGIWSDYVAYLERTHHGKLKAFSFRDKRNQDNGQACSYMIGDREFAVPLGQDPYCKLYFANCMLRPSCHSCRFCTMHRDSDMTIGDFWGIQHVRPELDDGMGTSLVMLHTDKAVEIWEAVKEKTRWFPCSKEDALQPRLLSPTHAAGYRRIFMAMYRRLPFSTLMRLVTLRQRWGRIGLGSWKCGK